MADHWITPEARGLYGTPESRPPQPQHHSANDFGARMARMEEHIQWQGHNLNRVEHESLRRAADIVNWIKSVHSSTEAKIRALEDHNREQSARRKLLVGILKTSGNIASTTINIVKYGIAGVLLVGWLLGKLSLEGVRLFLGVLGLPTG